MKHPRLKREYAGCYTYTGNTDEFRISSGYSSAFHRNMWKVFRVPITTTDALFATVTLKAAVNALEANEKKQDNRKPRLNHERFGRGDGELARHTWESETYRRVDFSYWLYSMYEPDKQTRSNDNGDIRND